jgi:hypothetical protein
MSTSRRPSGSCRQRTRRRRCRCHRKHDDSLVLANGERGVWTLHALRRTGSTARFTPWFAPQAATKESGSAPFEADPLILMAERTGLEPATPGVTGRYSNQLNYRSAAVTAPWPKPSMPIRSWRPLGDSNPCNHRERVVSWASRRRGRNFFTSLEQRSCGGGKRDRTADLLHAMQALSQLSYTPVVPCRCCCLARPQPDTTLGAVQASPRV